MKIRKASTVQLVRKCVELMNENPDSYLIPILKGAVRARGMKNFLKVKESGNGKHKN